MAVDTLEYAKELEAGVTPQQAEAHGRALKKAVDAGLVTKPDLDQAVARLEGKIDQNVARLEGKLAGVETRLDGKIDRLESKLDREVTRLDGRLNLLTWMVGFNLAATLGVLWKLQR